jgi:hypothetical protein
MASDLKFLFVRTENFTLKSLFSQCYRLQANLPIEKIKICQKHKIIKILSKFEYSRDLRQKKIATYYIKNHQKKILAGIEEPMLLKPDMAGCFRKNLPYNIK